jgi:2-amino-4-hydroxy-6-hydroxymethyldihydropteridine diphosphokinase/dihydropteroate synthase
VLERLTEKHRHLTLRPLLSVDTYHTDVARRALALGADMINDVSGLGAPEMIELAAATGAQWVAMHSLGVPADPSHTLPVGEDPCAEVERWLEQRLERWQRAGLDLDRIIFDPGIGFGKNSLQSLKLLRNVARFQRFGLRCLIGHSRKSFMRGFAAADNAEKDLATIGASLHVCGQGADILRVHNIRAHISAYRGWSHLNEP